MNKNMDNLKSQMYRLATKIYAPESLLPLTGEYARAGGKIGDNFRTDSHEYLDIDDSGYHLVCISRSIEIKRITSRDINEIMYYVSDYVTNCMSANSIMHLNLKNPEYLETFYKKQLSLLRQLNHSWSKRKRNEINK